MEKNKKLYEPIRRGAPSLPFDFTEELKEMEIEIPYPRKVGKNKYEIAPGMYCNGISLNDFFEEWKRTLGQKKKYCFDYIGKDVMKWAPEMRKNVTKQMLYMIPSRIRLPFIMSDRYIPAIDYYGEVIDDYDEWSREREEYIEELYKKLKNEDK